MSDTPAPASPLLEVETPPLLLVADAVTATASPALPPPALPPLLAVLITKVVSNF